MAKRLLLVLVLAAATVSAQPAPRRATNLAALIAYPAFFHLRPIALVGTLVVQDDGEWRVTADGLSMRLVSKAAPPDGPAEIRGEFWDLGRMNADDPRLSGYDLRKTFGIDPEGPWPRAGYVTAIVASTIQPASPPAAPSVRNVVLYPSRYLEQSITVSGQFSGRNLLGDLPDAPAQSRYDFVLRSGDGAIWITNLRPRGRDFELALDARLDTGKWLQVTGTLQQGRGLQWLDAQAGSLRLIPPPGSTTEDAPIQISAAPAPEVVFSAPTGDETDVPVTTSVRIQFSRDIDASTFRNRVRIAYSEAEARLRGAAAPPPAEFTTQYLPGTRVLEIRFRNPLERLRTVTVDLMDGIVGADKQPLKPWTLTFQTGS